MKRVLLAVFLTAALATQAAAQSAVFIVRHAERADDGAATLQDDPDLSEAGKARAESLGRMLADAGITAIFATQYKRTQQTAGPLARALGLTVTTIHSDDTPQLLERLKKHRGNALVVGHSGSVIDVIKGLGVQTSIELGHTDYDNLFIVTTGSEPKLVRLRFR